MKQSLLLCLAAAVLVAGCATSGGNPYGGADFRDVIARAKARVQPAVLYVVCVQENAERGEKSSQTVSGSAFLVSEDGEFVTNWHVVDKATSIRCLLSDGRHFAADCLGSDKSTDVALCKLRLPAGEKVPFASFGDSSGLEEGSFVIALGAPWGLNRSLTFGTISCARRYLAENSEYVLWLQTDAAIGPGNSGGPLVDTDGDVVGINALGMSTGSAAFGFAIPSEEAQIVVSRLRESGKVNWSWSGLLLQPLSDFERDTYFDATNGVLVAGAAPDSPAEAAGLRPGDRIVALNGAPVTAATAEELPAVRRAFGLLPDSDPIRLRVVRAGMESDVVLEPRAKGAVEGAEREFKRWDFSAKEINQFHTPDLFLRRNKGVYVLGCKRGGNADGRLQDRDIVLKVGPRDIETLDDLAAAHKEAMSALPAKHTAMFTVLRNGRRTLVTVDFLKDNH